MTDINTSEPTCPAGHGGSDLVAGMGTSGEYDTFICHRLPVWTVRRRDVAVAAMTAPHVLPDTEPSAFVDHDAVIVRPIVSDTLAIVEETSAVVEI